MLKAKTLVSDPDVFYRVYFSGYFIGIIPHRGSPSMILVNPKDVEKNLHPNKDITRYSTIKDAKSVADLVKGSKIVQVTTTKSFNISYETVEVVSDESRND